MTKGARLFYTSEKEEPSKHVSAATILSDLTTAGILSPGHTLIYTTAALVRFQPNQLRFSSVQSLDRLGRREDMRDDSAEILFQSFLQETTVSSCHCCRRSLNPTFPPPTTASPTFQRAPGRVVFGETVVVSDLT